MVAALCVLSLSVAGLQVGVGIGDATGAPVEVNFMGYAAAGQIGAGIHTRQHARAFVFADDNEKRFAFVSVDAGMGSSAVNRGVVAELRKRGLVDGKGQPLYSYANIAISGTHSHRYLAVHHACAWCMTHTHTHTHTYTHIHTHIYIYILYMHIAN